MFQKQVEALVGKKVHIRLIVSGSFVVNLIGILGQPTCFEHHPHPYKFDLTDEYGFVEDCAFSLKDVTDVRPICHFIEIKVGK